MKINSINTNHNQQSFNGIHFHNKAQLVKSFPKSIDKIMKLDHVQELVKSKEFNLHIKPGRLNLMYKIKAVGQGIKGFFRNIVSPWEKIGGEWIGKADIENYKTIWHPTPERIKQLRKINKELKLKDKARSKELKAEVLAKKQAEKTQKDKEIKHLSDIEKLNNR